MAALVHPKLEATSITDSKFVTKAEDHPVVDNPTKTNTTTERRSPKTGDPIPTTKSSPEPSEKSENKSGKGGSNAEIAQPLAPPPRPPAPQTSEAPDYFSTVHNNSHFSLEPNPFEQSFGNPSSETPGKLPSVAALTSPAPLTGNANLGGAYNWSNSLRSGPLSPAMLSGPTVEAGYFDSHLRGSFPTPNESSLRTGLTPGGGGSMFPAPSPNSQAMFSHLASGGATPSTLEFHRSAINAAAVNRKPDQQTFANGSSQATEQRAQIANMDQPTHQQSSYPHLGQHDNDAANGLFLLAQAGNESQSANQFAVPNQPAQGTRVASQSQETSPNMMKRGIRNGNSAMHDNNPTSIRGMSEQSGDMSEANSLTKPNTRAKNKRSSSGKGSTANRRKAEDPTSKQPLNKKAKTRASNSSANLDMNMEGIDTDDEQNIKEEQYQENKEDQYNENGRKMTDEEKRKNFLERNRVAALKCRQRKKQWLANLQAKVEIFSSENDALSATVAQLREEILNLKTILISHKDCPIAQNQGVGTFAQHAQGNEYNPHANPYNMAMQNGQQVMPGTRRYS